MNKISFGFFSIFILCSTVLSSSSEQSADSLLKEAQEFMIQGLNNEALSAFELAIAKDPSNYLNRFKRVAFNLSIGRNKQALEDLDIILKQKPDFTQAMFQRAKINLKQCKLEEAVADLHQIKQNEKTPEMNSMLQEAATAKANKLVVENMLKNEGYDPNAVLSILTPLVEICSQDAALREVRSLVYEKKGELLSAVGELNRAAALKPDNIAALQRAALLQLKLGEIDAALQSVKSCLSYDPEHKSCMKTFKTLKKFTKAVLKAEELISKGKFRDALGESALNMAKTGKKDAGALMILDELDIQGEARKKVTSLLCDVVGKLKRKDEILKWCAKCTELDPNDGKAFNYIGEVYLEKEEYQEAVNAFTRAQEANFDARANLQKAQNLLRQSKKKNYYKILGVKKSASPREIKKAYRDLAKEFHPDKCKLTAEECQQRMADINLAYEVLSNNELRQKYDNGEDPNDPESAQQHQHPFGGGGGHTYFYQHSGGGNPFGGFGGGNPFGGGGGGFQFFH